MAITCPWCGTNYLEFISNCKNCGGPLPLPEAAPRLERAEINLPPPAPRPIANSFAWRLMFTEASGVVGLVFLILGGCFGLTGLGLLLGIVTFPLGLIFFFLGTAFLMAGGYLFNQRYQRAMKVVETLRSGEAARGEIVSVETNYNVQVNGRNPVVVTYQFEVNGRKLVGKVSTLNSPGPSLVSGHPACILYLPEQPEYNALYPHP